MAFTSTVGRVLWIEQNATDGIIALHDSMVPVHYPPVANVGSHQYFERHIRYDDRFEPVGTADSPAALRRRAA